MTEKSLAEGIDLTQVEALIRLAIKEDIGTGDLTSTSVLSRRAKARGTFMVKEDGRIAGLPLLPVVYRNINKNVKVMPLLEDGRMVVGGTPVAHVTGPAIAILSGERIALNFLQRLSGIATLAARFVEEVSGTNVEIFDTRKTMPGWRCLEKYAVRIGGGRNHRMGLFDHVLIKDNHLRLSAYQPIAEAVNRARQKCRPGTVVEVEAESLAQVEDALAAGADIIMLDNMAPELMTKAVKIIRAAPVVPRIEASGGVSLATARRIAQTGVDWISVGELTHSAPALDIGLDLDPL